MYGARTSIHYNLNLLFPLDIEIISWKMPPEIQYEHYLSKDFNEMKVSCIYTYVWPHMVAPLFRYASHMYWPIWISKIQTLSISISLYDTSLNVIQFSSVFFVCLGLLVHLKRKTCHVYIVSNLTLFTFPILRRKIPFSFPAKLFGWCKCCFATHQIHFFIIQSNYTHAKDRHHDRKRRGWE